MAKSTITITGTKRLLRKLDRMQDKSRIQQVVNKHGAEALRNAIKTVPVDTHELQKSIRGTRGNLTYTLSASKHYAGYVEYGTRKMKAQPYIEPSVKQVAVPFVNDLERVLKE